MSRTDTIIAAVTKEIEARRSRIDAEDTAFLSLGTDIGKYICLGLEDGPKDDLYRDEMREQFEDFMRRWNIRPEGR